MTVRSVWHLNPGQTREDTRLAPVGTWTPTGATTTRSGVVPGGNPLTLTVTGMTATVGIGRVVVQGTTGQGAYGLVVTAPETITIAPGAGQTRYDTIWIVAYDKLYDTSGQTLAAVVYQQGTPGSGAPPTAPASGTAYMRLWDIQVPAGASAGSPPNWIGLGLLTDRRIFSVSLGGIHPGADSGPGAYGGQYRDNPATGALERWDGTSWVPWSSAIRGIAPGSLAAGSYTGQWRDGAVGLERWSGTAWSKADGEWQPYVALWTASVTAPTLGPNGSLIAHWCRVGRKIDVEGTLALGVGSNGGTGLWNISLPVPAANDGILHVGGTCNYVIANTQEWLGIVQIPPGGTAMGFLIKTAASGDSTGGVSNTSPTGAATTTRVHFYATYKAAS
ncbi:hypothetical protein [Kitasatospora sp. NPDC005856]|uniref:hypothetical protein n=1 Tax=Kitasatospora sp. NPDC005856 TaxID=3154566 RepID=UPI0033C23AF0